MAPPSVDKIVLGVLAVVAAAALLATQELIKPFPHKAPWYESAAMFPRVALGLAVIAAMVELWARRRATTIAESDELDSSGARIGIATAVFGLFVLYSLAVPLIGYLISTLAFLCLCGFVLKLGPRQLLLLALPLSIALWGIFVLVLKVAFGHGWLI